MGCPEVLPGLRCFWNPLSPKRGTTPGKHLRFRESHRDPVLDRRKECVFLVGTQLDCPLVPVEGNLGGWAPHLQEQGAPTRLSLEEEVFLH